MNQQQNPSENLWNSQGVIPRSPFNDRFQDIVKETINELYSNPRYWDFFSLFNEDSVHDFIVEYASKKAWYLVNGDRLITKSNNEELIYHETAMNCLWEIQQLKLFRLQASWRAGLTELPEIEVTRDFLCWEKNISRCPLIEPITLPELNHYMEYVRSESFSLKNWLYDWQDYEVFRNKATDKDLSPSWYKYNRSFSGLDHLEMLRDVKGEEEKHYISVWKKHHRRNVDAEQALLKRNLPDLYLNFETIEFFIKTFENRKLQNCYEAAESRPEMTGNEQELQESLRILSRSSERIRLPEAADWREAVIKGANEHRRNKILEHLPAVYDDYLFRLRTGIAFDNQHDAVIYQEYLDHTLTYREMVREGRRLAMQ